MFCSNPMMESSVFQRMDTRSSLWGMDAQLPPVNCHCWGITLQDSSSQVKDM